MSETNEAMLQEPYKVTKATFPETSIATLADGELVEVDVPPEPRAMTPAQAKSAAVSSLMTKSVERASELRLTPEETKALKADFPDECFRGGAAGKEALIYCEGLHLRNRLDDVLGIGQWCLLPRSRWTEEGMTKGNDRSPPQPFVKVYVEAMLIVRGCYITEAIGDMDYFPNNAQTNFGDAVEGAESAALRRCAKKMGIGLQAWSKSWCEGWWARKRGQKPAQQPAQQPRQQAQAPKPDVPAKDPELEAATQEWNKFLDTCPNVKELNNQLPALKKWPDRVWKNLWKNLLLPWAETNGWVWESESKLFFEPTS